MDEAAVIVRDIRKKGGNIGTNAQTMAMEDLVDSGVIDPTKAPESAPRHRPGRSSGRYWLSFPRKREPSRSLEYWTAAGACPRLRPGAGVATKSPAMAAGGSLRDMN